MEQGGCQEVEILSRSTFRLVLFNKALAELSLEVAEKKQA